MVREVKKNRKIIAGISMVALSLALVSCTGPTGGKLVREATKALESTDPVMGDWQGSWRLDDGSNSGQVVAQVIALGTGKYRAN
ncbi:MAG: hypothetical protein ACYTEO_13450, partial [Planctomycetota bacterium]